jgi:IrrE N-terminal-like domain
MSPLSMLTVRSASLKSHISEIEQAAEIFNGMISTRVTQKAGSIRCVKRARKTGERNTYRIFVNKNHAPAVRFATLAHELAHLFLGHLGLDEALHIPARSVPEHRQRELEAESAAFIVCKRNGVLSKSQTYLKSFVDDNATADNLDIYRIMWAAGQIETLLGLGARTAFDRSRKAQ